MRSYRYIVLVLLIIISCSNYQTKTVLKKGSSLSKVKSSGIIFRLPKDSPIEFDKMNSNLSNWLQAYKKVIKLQVLDNVSDKIKVYDSPFDRFYHLSENLNFLEYKSIGNIKQYIRNNENELNRIITEKNLDNLIIYEVDSTLSPEMRMMEFESILLVLDKNFNIIFLDHQKNAYPEKKTTWDLIAYGDVKDDIDYFNEAELKSLFYDKICDRLINKLMSLDFLDD